MEDLRNLHVTCREIHSMCNNAGVDRRVVLERFAVELQWNNRKGYDTLLDCRTHKRNLEPCFISRMDILFGENYSSRSSIAKLKEASQAGHNVAAYVAAWSSTRPMATPAMMTMRGGTSDRSRARKNRWSRHR
jgi:hypothetical protein